MKVLLLNPPSEKGYIRSGRWTRKSRANQQWYPIWLGYATALLQREGHECLLLDAGAENLDLYQTTTRMKKFSPDLVAFYWSYDTAGHDLYFAEAVQKTYDVVLVGPWSFCLPDSLDVVDVKFMTHGEFEHTLLALANDVSPSNIAGLSYKIKGLVYHNAPVKLCSPEELDRIPFVTEVYNKFLNLNNYRQTSFRLPFVDLLGARGCPYHCTFCLWIRAFQGGPSYRPRSIKNVMEELWYIKNEMPQVKQIHFQDDTLPPKRARELSQAILDEGLSVCWGGYSRADQSYETLALMKESGCRTLHVGYEVPIQRHLDLIQKDMKVEQMQEFAEYIQKLGMWTCGGFMIFPWMTKEEVEFVINWARKVARSKRFSFTRLFAYPNTPVCETIKQQSTLLTQEEMIILEKKGLIENYLYNPSFWWETLKCPGNWRNVFVDGVGLLKFLREKD